MTVFVVEVGRNYQYLQLSEGKQSNNLFFTNLRNAFFAFGKRIPPHPLSAGAAPAKRGVPSCSGCLRLPHKPAPVFVRNSPRIQESKNHSKGCLTTPRIQYDTNEKKHDVRTLHTARESGRSWVYF